MIQFEKESRAPPTQTAISYCVNYSGVRINPQQSTFIVVECGALICVTTEDTFQDAVSIQETIVPKLLPTWWLSTHASGTITSLFYGVSVSKPLLLTQGQPCRTKQYNLTHTTGRRSSTKAGLRHKMLPKCPWPHNLMYVYVTQESP